MTDLLAGRINLEMFRGLAAVGGFSYADVPESAKGWAATILFNHHGYQVHFSPSGIPFFSVLTVVTFAFASKNA